MSILISCFEPFGGDSCNSSQEALTLLSSRRKDFVSLVLPTTFSGASEKIMSAIDAKSPQLVIMLGEAAGRSAISLEQLAVNYADARIPDNDGIQPSHRKILEEGPLALETNIPLSTLRKILDNENIPTTISYFAGTFVCNFVFYKVLHHVLSHGRATGVGFVHLPLCEKQAIGRPDVTLVPTSISARAVELILDAAVHCR